MVREVKRELKLKDLLRMKKKKTKDIIPLLSGYLTKRLTN